MGTYLRMTPAMRAVLGVLCEADDALWGLRISQLAGRPTGTVYPLLDRLEREGFLTSHWDTDGERSGPRRRLYVLTPPGQDWAREKVAASGSQHGGAR